MSADTDMAIDDKLRAIFKEEWRVDGFADQHIHVAMQRAYQLGKESNLEPADLVIFRALKERRALIAKITEAKAELAAVEATLYPEAFKCPIT